MSEYVHIEKPCIKQLAALGWAVIDQGPYDPASSPGDLRRAIWEVSADRSRLPEHDISVRPDVIGVTL